MTFANSAIASIPQSIFHITPDQVQFSVFFVIAVILYMITGLMSDIIEDANKPNLSLNNLNTNYKPVYTHPIRIVGNEVKTESNKIAEFYFAYVDVNNNPKTRNTTSSAKAAHAEIIFTPQKGQPVYIKHGRWCDQDTPLLCGESVDVNSLKIVDIDPGNPASLALAFKKKKGNDIYAYYFTDHKRFTSRNSIAKVLKERALGIPPIQVTIRVDGIFDLKEFHRILDIDEKGNFVSA